MSIELSRRAWLTATSALATGLVAAAEPKRTPQEPFGYCLNTSTLFGQKLKLPAVIAVAARAGYQAVEPWLREIEQYVKDGGSLKDLRKRLRDNGLEVPSAISFTEWVVADAGRRKKAPRTAQARDGLAEPARRPALRRAAARRHRTGQPGPPRRRQALPGHPGTGR